MKNSLILLILCFKATTAYTQSNYFQPLEVDSIQDNRLLDARLIGDKLVYSTFRYYDLLQAIISGWPNLQNNDSIVSDLYSLNVTTMDKYHKSFKKPSFNRTIHINKLYETESKLVKFYTSNIEDDVLVNPQVYGTAYNDSIFSDRSFVTTSANLQSISIANEPTKIRRAYTSCVYDDSIMIIVEDRPDSAIKSRLLKVNYSQNKILDSGMYSASNLKYYQIEKHSQNLIIAITDSGTIKFDSNLNVLSFQYYNTIFNPNQLPGSYEYSSHLMNEDTSFYYFSQRVSFLGSNYVTSLNRINGNSSYRMLIHQYDNDSVGNITGGLLSTANMSNVSALYPAHIYSVADIGFGSPLLLSTVSIFKYFDNGQLAWKKYIGFDKYYNRSLVLATPDSGCLVLVNALDHPSGRSDFDLYYIKLDKDGNQQYDYLPLNTKDYLSKPKQFLLYPNPSSSVVFFQSSNKLEEHLVELYSIDGKYITKASMQNGYLDISNLPVSTYAYVIKNKQSEKLIQYGLIEKK